MWEIYEQRLYENDEPPGSGWEPFGVIGSVEHNGIKESLGGGYEHWAVVYWRRLKESYKLEEYSI